MTKDSEYKYSNHTNPDQICVLVSSSDNTRDVFKNVMASYEKFWSDCHYSKYAGLNSIDDSINNFFKIVTSPVGGWRSELLNQVEALPQEITHILLMLDDFLLLAPVDAFRLEYLIDKAIKGNADCMRLVPLSTSVFCRLLRWMMKGIHDDMEPIMVGTPYYSSLQPSLWKREHLAAMLRLPGSIWDFENQSIQGAKHYAINRKPPIRCVHVVEKGQWMADAALRFNRLGIHFEPGSRQLRPVSEIPILWYRQAKFALIGYTGLRVRRMLVKLSSVLDGKGQNDPSRNA